MIKRTWQSFKDYYDKVTKKESMPKNHVYCPACSGFGLEGVFEDCEYCKGKGNVHKLRARRYSDK